MLTKIVVSFIFYSKVKLFISLSQYNRINDKNQLAKLEIRELNKETHI